MADGIFYEKGYYIRELLHNLAYSLKLGITQAGNFHTY